MCCLWQAWLPLNVGVHVSYMWGAESPEGDQHLAKLAAGRQVVGKVKLEVEYVPFKTDPDAKATMARRLTRRMSRSKINADHKGVLTVALIKATNLAVRTPASGYGVCLRFLWFSDHLGSLWTQGRADREPHKGHQPGRAPTRVPQPRNMVRFGQGLFCHSVPGMSLLRIYTLYYPKQGPSPPSLVILHRLTVRLAEALNSARPKNLDMMYVCTYCITILNAWDAKRSVGGFTSTYGLCAHGEGLPPSSHMHQETQNRINGVCRAGRQRRRGPGRGACAVRRGNEQCRCAVRTGTVI